MACLRTKGACSVAKWIIKPWTWNNTLEGSWNKVKYGNFEGSKGSNTLRANYKLEVFKQELP